MTRSFIISMLLCTVCGAEAAAQDAGPVLAPVWPNVRAAGELGCMTAAIYYEAANEPDAGQEAVAQVILNRVADPRYPSTVCDVVFQGSTRRTGCQFTFTCDGALARKPNEARWDRAWNVAQAAISRNMADRVGPATHYHADYVNPYWSASLNRVGKIGRHIFYSSRASARAPGAQQSGAPASGITVSSIARQTTPESPVFAVWGLPVTTLTR